MTERADNPLFQYVIKNPEALAQNIARFIEEGGRAAAAYIEPREKGETRTRVSDDLAEVLKTIGQIGEFWLSDPKRAIEAQARLWTGYMTLWDQSLRRMMGEPSQPAAEPDPKDKRFKDPEWSQNQFFDFLKQAYLITSRWADSLVEDANEVDDHTRHKAAFYIRQIANAISPSNFILTNPELLRETMSSNGENLVRGMKMLAEDIKAGHGELKLRQTDKSKFALGRNLAMTPGKVVAQNRLRQLIQYTPTTDTVRKRPLVIVPPWINKYYILDLTPEKSLVRWLVDQGHTVFMVSWVNPDAGLANVSFEDYMREGILETLDAVTAATGEEEVDVTGYCVGGTLLAVALAHMANTGDKRVRTASFLTAQTDFTHAGDLKVFVDEEQLCVLEARMQERGYLDGAVMANTFNLLRSNDLLWPYVVNNYMLGKEPFPFDLLYWNSDSTRMPAANHAFYMRKFYLENAFAQGKLSIDGAPLLLKKIKQPAYHLATREDHIAPAKSVFTGAALFGGPVRFVMAGSGHIAGVCNPPALKKYQHWTGPKPKGEFDDWLPTATEHPGSWWPDWDHWLKSHDRETVPARIPGTGGLEAIEDAPGSFVRAQGG